MKKVKNIYVSKISSKGQVTLPSYVRDTLRVRPGDSLMYNIGDNGAVVLTSPKYSLEDICGILPPLKQVLSVKEMLEIAKESKVANDYR